MTPLARLTTILARTPGIPDSTPLTMGGEVELEVTMGDLRALEKTASALVKLMSDLQEEYRQLDARPDIEDDDFNGGRYNAKVEVFWRIWRFINGQTTTLQSDREHADEVIAVRAARTGLTLADFRAASRFLTEGEGT